jgi:predicted RNA-binding protein YlxR (DUF448 family)
MSKAKHIPQRKCCGCGEMFGKPNLIRVVKTKTAEEKIAGEIIIDKKGNTTGRGAYICKNISCAETAEKKRGLERTLKYGNADKKSKKNKTGVQTAKPLEQIYADIRNMVRE